MTGIKGGSRPLRSRWPMTDVFGRSRSWIAPRISERKGVVNLRATHKRKPGTSFHSRGLEVAEENLSLCGWRIGKYGGLLCHFVSWDLLFAFEIYCTAKFYIRFLLKYPHTRAWGGLIGWSWKCIRLWFYMKQRTHMNSTSTSMTHGNTLWPAPLTKMWGISLWKQGKSLF